MISVHATLDTHSCHASSRYLTVRSCPHLRSVNCTHLQLQNLLLKILPGIPVLSSFVMLFVKFLTWVMSVSVWIVHCCQLHDTDGSPNIPPEVADDLYRRSMHASFVQPVKMFNNEDLNRNSNIQRISNFDLNLGNCNEIAELSEYSGNG